MAELIVVEDMQALSNQAAEIAVSMLKQALTGGGAATWVLAGGSAPMGAYSLIADKYQAALNWQDVTFILGDERCVEHESMEANWNQIEPALLQHLILNESKILRPQFELSAEAAAKAYNQAISKLPKNEAGTPRLDHVWLGMGEDGHTLSLFPANAALADTSSLVVPVHDSPKPPPDRISLSLAALANVGSCLVLVGGAGKAEVLARAHSGDQSLPVVQVVNAVEAGGGQVTWLVDKAASLKL